MQNGTLFFKFAWHADSIPAILRECYRLGDVPEIFALKGTKFLFFLNIHLTLAANSIACGWRLYHFVDGGLIKLLKFGFS